jgi:toxin YhaV
LARQVAVRSAHGWELWFGELFAATWVLQRKRVKQLKAKRKPSDFAMHPEVKLFAALVNIVHEVVPRNPEEPEFRLGGTLGSKYTNWRRVKGHGLPTRMRLFFKYSSSRRVIVFAWLNDEGTLRKAGAPTDVYTVFQNMLKSGNPPDDLDSLLARVSAGK